MKDFKNLIKEAHLGNPLNEVNNSNIQAENILKKLFGKKLDPSVITILVDEINDIIKKKPSIKDNPEEIAKELAKDSDIDPKLLLKPRMGFIGEENDEETDYMRRRRGDYSDDMEDGMTDYERRRRETSDYMNEDLLKEFTLPGGDFGDSYANRLPEEELTTTDDYELFMEMFPRGEASRILMDPNRKKLYDQHLEWTKDSQYNNVFQHMQYHDVEYEGEPYRIHQTQYYNTNYKDFRNPRFTELMISKDGKRMGTYLVDTTEYIKDLKDLEVKKRVSEGTCGYGEDGKIGKIPAGPHLNEVESGDIVTYKGKDHTVMRIEDDDLGVRVYIRPNEESYYGGKKDTFWVKPKDLNEGYLERAIEDEKDPKKLAMLKAKKEFYDNNPKEKRRGMSDKEIGDEVRRLLKRNFMEEEIETSLTPNEIGDLSVEKESDSAAYESLQESLRKKLQDRLK